MKTKNLFQKIGIIIIIFIIVHIFSYLGYLWPTWSGIFFWLIFLSALIFAIWKIEYGFCFLLAEFFIGHEGLFFEFADISIRLALFLMLMVVWGIKFLKEKERKTVFKNFFKDPGLIILLILFFFILLAFLQGLIRNDFSLAFKDFINYAYLFLIFPLIGFFQKKDLWKNIFTLAKGAIIGISILTLILFILSATGVVQVHDHFYWWWRGTVIGKITDAGNNFFRIVTPAHLLVLPFFMVCLGFLLRKKIKPRAKKIFLGLTLLTSLILVLNFSRAYFLGIFAGLLFFKKDINWSKWLKIVFLVFIILMVEFVAIFGIVSGGKIGEGFNIFTGRIETIAQPEKEASSLTRMNILPKLLEEIKKAPFFGQGLGSTITIFDVTTNQEKTTFHLDWGYLEMWREIGLVGLVSYGLLIFYIFYFSFKKMRKMKKDSKERRLILGLLAGLISLMVTNLTAPVLFHSLGIFYFVFIWALIFNLKENDLKTYCSNRYLE